MENDKEPSLEDFPVDGKMIGVDPNDHQFGLCAVRRRLCFAAEDGDVGAMTELLQIAQALSAEINLDTETSLDRIALASLIQPIKYLLGDETAKLAAFGSSRDPNRPESKEIEQRDIEIAYTVGRNLGAGNRTTDATARAKDEADAKKKAAEVFDMDIRTVQRVCKKYPLEVTVAETSTRNSLTKKS
ncbi:hypothetical protein [Nitrosovibrio sp. Nv6]|uniref:hypothetical protein n=1 Tax=Nitrosovibrio sp. Nv6 TaxID=1855340 RepID=UPI0008D406EF|nr:hypothetical protein [Nitrosovibrio sp. Nv6]SEO85317.1 hypothetical protein SAMN05216316_1272 [Nitrosovibrio sp. Nv6]